MEKRIDIAIDTLIDQYPRLVYNKKAVKNIKEPVFEMPIPVPPHKSGDIILSAHYRMRAAEPYHRHDYFLINYAYRGDWTEVIEQKEVTIHEGEVYLSQPFVAHALMTHDGSEDAILSIRIRKELIFRSLLPVLPKHEEFLDFFLAPLNAAPSDPHKYMILSGDAILNDSIRTAIHTLILEYVNMYPCYETLLDSALAMLFSYLSRCHSVYPRGGVNRRFH